MPIFFKHNQQLLTPQGLAPMPRQRVKVESVETPKDESLDAVSSQISAFKEKGEKPERIKEAMGLMVDDAFSEFGKSLQELQKSDLGLPKKREQPESEKLAHNAFRLVSEPAKALARTALTAKNVMEDLMPFLESDRGRELKESALKNYPLSDQAKKVARQEVKVRDTSRDLEFADKYGGRAHNAILADFIYGANKILLREDLESPESNDLPDFIEAILKLPLPGRTKVEVKELTDEVVAHELLHGLVNETQTNFRPGEFNEAWDSLAPNDRRLQKIDATIAGGSKDIYKDAPSEYIANERFAYFGSRHGQDGLSQIPTLLRPHYLGIFADKSADRKSSEGKKESQDFYFPTAEIPEGGEMPVFPD